MEKLIKVWTNGNEDSEGWGHCKNLDEPTACSEYCERWEEK